jgi:hypothetical protein|tara:strand:+ start:1161 stop:1421 length:261 start_codon:yes stop_codon:yes gene_type:complete
MPEIVEGKKHKEMEELALRIGLDIRDVINTLNAIVKDGVTGLNDDQLHMRSIPTLVVKELERIYEKNDEVWAYLCSDGKEGEREKE